MAKSVEVTPELNTGDTTNHGENTIVTKHHDFKPQLFELIPLLLKVSLIGSRNAGIQTADPFGTRENSLFTILIE